MKKEYLFPSIKEVEMEMPFICSLSPQDEVGFIPIDEDGEDEDGEEFDDDDDFE